MNVLTRRQHAEGILAQLRGVGPQTVAQIREDLGLTKREVDGALWLLGATGKVEYDTVSPLTYKATTA